MSGKDRAFSLSINIDGLIMCKSFRCTLRVSVVKWGAELWAFRYAAGTVCRKRDIYYL